MATYIFKRTNGIGTVQINNLATNSNPITNVVLNTDNTIYVFFGTGSTGSGVTINLTVDTVTVDGTSYTSGQHVALYGALLNTYASDSVTIGDGVNGSFKATVAQFHNADNQSLPSTANGLLGGGVAQLVNPVGNLDRQRGTGYDNISSVGVATGTQQLKSPIATTLNGAVAANVTSLTLTATKFTNGGVPAWIGIGSILVLEPNTANQEQVVVTAVNYATNVVTVYGNGVGANVGKTLFAHANGAAVASSAYNEARDASTPEGSNGAGFSASATFLFNQTLNANAGGWERERSAAGELDGATGVGTAVAAEYEYNGGGPGGSNYDRARSVQAKLKNSGTISGGNLAAATYYYVVTATNALGETIKSNEINIVAAANSANTISWGAVTGATGYKVYRGVSAGGENVFYAVGNVTSYVDNGAASTAGTPPATNTSGLTSPTQNAATTSATGGTLAAGTYYYVITPLNSIGEALKSNEVSIVTTGTTSSNTLSWTAVTGATSYRVYRGTAAGAENVYYAVGNVTTYVDTNAASTAGTPPATNNSNLSSPVQNAATTIAGAQTAGVTSITLSSLIGLQAGEQVTVDRGSANAEALYVASNWTGVNPVIFTSATQFGHPIGAPVEWDDFAISGPGLNGFLATGIGIEEEALYNPVDGLFYLERASTTDNMSGNNVVAENGVLWNGTGFDRARSVNGDGQAATGLSAANDMLFNGTTFDRARSVSGDGMTNTGLEAATDMLFNGTTYDRARSVAGDAQAAIGIEAATDMLYNGATYDRPRSATGDAMPTTGIPAEAAMIWNGTAFDRLKEVSGDAQPATGLAAEVPMLWNGTSYDRQKGNVDTAAIQTLTAAAAGVNSADQTNYNGRGVKVVINVTAITGTTPSLTVTLQGKDAASGVYYNQLVSGAITAVGTTVLTIYPGLTTAANVTANDILPRTWRIISAIGGTTPAVTATIGASVII